MEPMAMYQYWRQNVNASNRVQRKKRAAVSRPRDRKDAGPSPDKHRTSCPSACENPCAPVVPDGTWVGDCSCIGGLRQNQYSRENFIICSVGILPSIEMVVRSFLFV